MSPILVLVRRELGETFRSPLAYVFLVLFLVFSQLFFVLDVFELGRADLTPFWQTLPWSIVVFAGLVTMRSWAEERQQNTYEMLLTFPVSEGQLVVAKFLSATAFLGVGLAATVTLPLLLFSVGSPDLGALLSGYLGAFLLAATWCAAGVFLSGLTRSQLLAALITLVSGVTSLVIGIPGITERFDARTGGIGGLLASAIGGWEHYAAFGRGVVELADVLFFVGWTVGLLYLNALHLTLRRNPTTSRTRVVGAVLVVGSCLLGGRLLSGTSLARFDLTSDRRYTLSDATLRIVERARAPIAATLYITPADEMPPGFERLEDDVTARLAELAAATGGRIETRVVYLDAARVVGGLGPTGPESETERTRERRLAEKGVTPFTVRSVEETGTTTRAIYATLGLAYGAKDEVYVPSIRPGSLDELEYAVAARVAGLVRARAPRLALHAGIDHSRADDEVGRPPPYAGLAAWLRDEGFDVVTTELRDGDRLPTDFDALVLMAPKELSERAAWEIDRALASGRPVFLAVQRGVWRMAVGRDGVRPYEIRTPTGLEEWMDAIGVRVTEDRLLDRDQFPWRYPTDDAGVRGRGGVQYSYPFQVRLTQAALSESSPATRGVSNLIHLWGTTVELDRRQLLAGAHQIDILVESPETSWVVPGDRALVRGDFDPAGKEQGERPLAALLRGRFEPTLSAAERPRWPYDPVAAEQGIPIAADPEYPDLVPREGALFVMSSARLFSDRARDSLDHRTLLRNVLDVLTLDEDLLEVRTRRATDRSFPRPSAGVALFWTLVPLAGVPLTVVAIGAFVGLRRRRRRATWNARHDR